MLGKEKKKKEAPIYELTKEIVDLREELYSLKRDFSTVLSMVKPAARLYNCNYGLIRSSHLRLDYIYNDELKSVGVLNIPSYFYKILEETAKNVILEVADYGNIKYFKVIKETGSVTDITDVIDINKYKKNKSCFTEGMIQGVKCQNY